MTSIERGFDVPLVLLSLLGSWTYLRFAIVNKDGTIGDMSEEFAFPQLFPESLSC